MIRALPLLLVLATGCTHARYLAQAASGQLSLMQNARSVSSVVRDSRTPPRTRRLLNEVRIVKRFGEAHGLKPTANYGSYVQLDRPAVVWVVSACAPLEFKSRVWSFPFVGDFPYLGWFDLKDARGYADELRKEGLDVDVRGASAYSTLGILNDPILSSMISEGDEALGELVNVVLHESVHATVHVPSQAIFNESLASFVADRLTLEYLDVRAGQSSPERTSYGNADAAGRSRALRLHEVYDELDALYRSARPREQKLAEKGRILAALKDELKLRREPNNAMLVQHRTYDTGSPQMEELFRACGESWSRFLDATSTLSSSSFGAPQAKEFGPALRPLIERACAGPARAEAAAARP